MLKMSHVQDYTDVLFRRWVVHYFCMNIKECYVSSALGQTYLK